MFYRSGVWFFFASLPKGYLIAYFNLLALSRWDKPLTQYTMKPSNRLSLDYNALGSRFPRRPSPIIDVHSHIHGELATKIYADAAEHYGIGLTYSMTSLQAVPTVKSILGDRVSFIAIPDFANKDRLAAFGPDYVERLKEYHKLGSRIAKFWSAPRIYEASHEPFATSPCRLNSPLRMEAMKAAYDLGMIFMVHIGDPDTWFATKYRDAKRYGTKHEQYELLEDVLERFNTPWIAAHMGGFPEDLDFLSSLLARHSNLYLDCSATKWIVRELSKHPPEKTREFFMRWSGRILFGSDIVTSDAHVSSQSNASEMEAKASNAEEAYDLYASRYWALRTLIETSHEGESPIADPDLHLVAPERHTPLDAPVLRGFSLPERYLDELYRGAAEKLLG